MQKIVTSSLVLCALLHICIAQNNDIDDMNANVRMSSFEARLSTGFNYDLLRDPTGVSFEYPMGYFGFNLPLQATANLKDYIGLLDEQVDSIFSDSTLISNGDEFKPKASARQNPNSTVRVDVPMMGGVGTFSNIQNFYFKYENMLGNPDYSLSPESEDDGLSVYLRGTLNVPFSVSMSWETMTFGYAYRVNRNLTFAINLHRHIFSFDLRGKVDADILGRYEIEVDNDEDSEYEIPSISGELNYSSSRVYGYAYGHYENEVWTPTIGIEAWRFSLISRFGINTKAHGEFYAKYSLPFFIDPETFDTKYDFNDPDIVNDSDVRQGLVDNATDSITYSTNKNLTWKMPTGLTLSFEIIPEILRFSYTKLFGDIQFKIDEIIKESKAVEEGSERLDENDSISVDLGVSVDHIMMLQCNLFNAFLNVGVFGMDFRYDDEKNMLGSNMPYAKLGSSAMLPVLNMGSALGTKLQLLLELDILPLPAIKTGVYYHF